MNYAKQKLFCLQLDPEIISNIDYFSVLYVILQN